MTLALRSSSRLRAGRPDDVVSRTLDRLQTPFEAAMGSIADHAAELVSAYLQSLYPAVGHARPNSNHIAAARRLRLIAKAGDWHREPKDAQTEHIANWMFEKGIL